LVNGLLRWMISRIFFSITGRSSVERPVNGSVALEVVVEAVLDHRADGHLRARPQLLHGFCHHMGRIVPDQLQGARIIAGDDTEIGIFVDGIGEVLKTCLTTFPNATVSMPVYRVPRD
jgi:hypothetical protein